MTETLKCNSCNIVIDELLAYVQNKLSLIDEESLVKICVSTFNSDQIKKSKSLLFESIPSDLTRKPTRKGHGKEDRTMYDIISVFKVIDSDVMPIFVARNLEKLPPITFDHLDVSDLLKKIVILQEEVKNLKSTCVTVSQLDDLKSVLLESKSQSSPTHLNINTRRGACTLDESDSNQSETQLCESSVVSELSNSRNLSSINKVNALSADTNNSGNVMHEATTVSHPRSMSTSFVTNEITNRFDEQPLNEQPRKQTAADIVKQSLSLTENRVNDEGWTEVKKKNRYHLKNRLTGMRGVASDSAESFRAAERNVPIFITNVHKSATEADIVSYIMRKTQVSVKLEKINAKRQSEHYAYKFFVAPSKVQTFLDDKLWPQGVIFRKFVHFKPKSAAQASCTGNGSVNTVINE